VTGRDPAPDPTVRACPECDGVRVLNAVGGNLRGPGKTLQDYRCEDCGARFDEPNRRRPHSGGRNAPGGLARALERADPDEVGP